MDYNHISVCLDILQRLQDDGGSVQDNANLGFGNSIYLANYVKEMADRGHYIQLLEISPTPVKLEDSKAKV